MTRRPDSATGLVYSPSNKHCEPLTPRKPGTECPRWSAASARELLATSEAMGARRVATRHGLAFVAQPTGDGTWHGYPESWDKIDPAIRARRLAEKRIRQRDLRQWASRDDIRTAWKELENAG